MIVVARETNVAASPMANLQAHLVGSGDGAEGNAVISRYEVIPYLQELFWHVAVKHRQGAP